MILTVIRATEPGTVDLYGFERFQLQNFGSSLSRFSDIAGDIGVYGNSDRIPLSMRIQRLTRPVEHKSLDLYRVVELGRPLAQLVIKELLAINRYCLEQEHLHHDEFTYDNDSPVKIADFTRVREIPCGIQFHRSHTRLVNSFKHKVCE